MRGAALVFFLHCDCRMSVMLSEEGELRSKMAVPLRKSAEALFAKQ